MARPDRRSRLALLVYIVVLVGSIAIVRWQHPDLTHGAYLSDADVLIANRNWAEEGLGWHAGVPVLETFQQDGVEPSLYITYPAGPFYVPFVLRQLGIEDLRWWRMLPLLCSALAVLVGYMAVRRTTGSEPLALLFGVVYSFNPVFTGYADSLHQMSYSQLTLLAALYAWIRYEQATNNEDRRSWIALTGIIVFLDFWLTLEHVGLFAILLGLRWLVGADRRKASRGLWIVLGAWGLAAATRLAQLWMAFGGPSRAMELLGEKLALRVGLGSHAFGWTDAAHLWLVRLGLGSPGGNLAQTEFSFPLLSPGVALPAVGIVALGVSRFGRELPRPTKRALIGGAGLTLAGSHWILIMREHAFVHRHVIQLLLPGLALLLGGVLALGIESWKQDRGARRLISAALSVGILLGLGLNMRASEIANLIAPWHPGRSAVVQQRELRAFRLRELGLELRSARHVRIVPEWEGDIGTLLGVPFSYGAPEGSTHLPEGTIFFVELQDQVTRDPDRVAQWVRDFGEPRVQRLGSTEAWVFGEGGRR